MNESGTIDGGDAEFLLLMQKLGIDPMTLADPRTGYLHAVGRRRCRLCTDKERCRQALCQSPVRLGAMSSFCPNADLAFELSYSGLPRCA